MAKLSLLISVIRLNAIILTTLLINNCNCNHCPKVLKHTFEGFAPKGNRKAGTYDEVPDISELEPCVNNCCENMLKCNVAFLYNGTCYHVRCVSNQLCMPMKRTNMTAKMLRMVLVNPVSEDDPSWKKILQDENFGDYGHLVEDNEEKINNQNLYKLITMYEPAPKDSEINEAYSVPYKNFKNFDYPQGVYGPYGPTDQIMDETSFYPSAIQAHPCDLNKDCPPHEQCQTDKICSCNRNYVRNQQGICIRKKNLQPSLAQKLIMDNMRSYNAEPEEIFSEGGKSETTDSSAAAKQLTVSVVSKDVRLPENEATLIAYVIPDETSSGDKYSYTWKLITKPKGDTNGTMTDQTKDTVKLTNLAEGVYRFQVTVTGKSGKFGEAYTNVTVLPQDRRNKPPQVCITPNEQTIKLPNSNAILDGSASIDDDKIISWHWDLVQGPIGYQPHLTETNILQLNNLTIPGNYTFKLTVTDSDKISNSTTATIQVLKEIDYPPVANAGQTVILYLPNNNVTLNGSLSKDDHEIVAWEWTKDSKDQSKAVDMQNTRTPYLQLSNLEEGLYTFELKVTDGKNQSSTSSVHVFVKTPTNMPPVAKAGQNISISLPQTWAILNGTESKDDIKISGYFWKQISGPTISLILNSNASTANATALKIGEYIFELVVVDDVNNNATDRVKITVVQDKNTPPVSNGGGDQSVTLPVSAIVLNGSRSYDDLGIINYTWTREPGSLAIGTIIGNSNHEPVLIITNVVPGRYVFKLTVNDGQGLSGSDTVSVIVHPDPLIMNLVELTLTIEATSLNENELENLQQKLMLLMGDNVKINIRDLKIERKNGQVVIVFYVEKNIGSEVPIVVPALEVERVLKEKFWRDYSILGTSVSEIRTAICQNNCSNHGVCNEETRACMCQSFWMPDIFYFWGVSEANCDWSILYVIIGIFIVFLMLSGICWGLTCLCRRSSPNKPRTRTKTQKYALLGTQEDVTAFSRNGTTMSDSETDSDVLFESRKQNGTTKLVNGDTRNGHKYSMTRLGRRIKA